MAHLVELVCAFRNGPTGLKTSDKTRERAEIRCIGLLNGVTKYNNKAKTTSAESRWKETKSYGVKGAC